VVGHLGFLASVGTKTAIKRLRAPVAAASAYSEEWKEKHHTRPVFAGGRSDSFYETFRVKYGFCPVTRRTLLC